MYFRSSSSFWEHRSVLVKALHSHSRGPGFDTRSVLTSLAGALPTSLLDSGVFINGTWQYCSNNECRAHRKSSATLIWLTLIKKKEDKSIIFVNIFITVIVMIMLPSSPPSPFSFEWT